MADSLELNANFFSLKVRYVEVGVPTYNRILVLGGWYIEVGFPTYVFGRYLLSTSPCTWWTTRPGTSGTSCCASRPSP